MPLKLSPKPGEKFVLNGAVLANGDKRTSLVLQNKACVLREKDIMQPENATTPAATLILTDFVMVPPAYEPEEITITSPCASTWETPPVRVRQGVAMFEQVFASLPSTETNTRAICAWAASDKAASARPAKNRTRGDIDPRLRQTPEAVQCSVRPRRAGRTPLTTSRPNR